LSWLAQMDAALNSRNYDGTFVHEHAGQTETLRVIHRNSGGALAERLVSMDGSGREFVRKGNELLTYLPDQHAVLVEESSDASLVLGNLPQMEASLTERYTVSEVQKYRLLGRDTRVIAVVPKDDYRYGYRLWIDESTAMPLKTQLRDRNDAVVEQIVFTSLSLLAQVPESRLEPGVDARGYRWLRRSTVVSSSREQGVSNKEQAGWQATSLPPGFRLTARTTRQMPGADGPVAHLVFSDGLASVSVFVELKATADTAQPAEDSSQLGSSATYTTLVEGHRVTAIGEVPPATVRAIALALSADPEPSLRAIRQAVSGESQHGFSGVPSVGMGFGSSRGGGMGGGMGGAPGESGGPGAGGGGHGRPR
jgi:sigma-E factor negative regulatory protein RseB